MGLIGSVTVVSFSLSAWPAPGIDPQPMCPLLMATIVKTDCLGIRRLVFTMVTILFEDADFDRLHACFSLLEVVSFFTV